MFAEKIPANTEASVKVGSVGGKALTLAMLRELDGNNQTSIALNNHFGFSEKYSAIAKIPFGTIHLRAQAFQASTYPAQACLTLQAL